MTHAEWQQAERSGVSAKARKEAVTALYEQSDTGSAFKAALEEAGYVLAQGDRRDFVIVDRNAAIHSLGRQIRGVKAKDLREFMFDVDRAALPTAEQAKEMQRAAAQERQDQQPQPSAEEIAELERKLAQRQAEELARLTAVQEAEQRQKIETLGSKIADELEEFDAAQQAERRRRDQDIAESKTGILARLHDIRLRFSPALAAEEAQQREEAEEEFKRRQANARADERERLHRDKQKELDEMAELHAQQRREFATRQEQDRERYIRERAEALRLALELQERERQRQEERRRDGPDPPTRVR
jgi:hypothetical protein